MARPVEFAIKIGALETIWHWRDHGGLAGGGQSLAHALVGIEGLVGDQQISSQMRQQCIGAVQVMRLSRRQQEAHRIAERVGEGMDLCAQRAATVAKGLVFIFF